MTQPDGDKKKVGVLKLTQPRILNIRGLCGDICFKTFIMIKT